MPFIIQVIVVLVVVSIILAIVTPWIDVRFRNAIYGLCAIAFILWALSGFFGWGPGLGTVRGHP